MAPPRKPPEQRARRNKPKTIELGPAPVAPVLPEWARRNVWSIQWWETVWREPVSSLWTPADLPSLARLALLYGEVAAGVLDDSKLLSEIRALEDRFFLNPKSRQVAGIVMPKDEPAADEVKVPASVERRSRLKVV